MYSFNKYLSEASNNPWKIWLEIRMILLKPFTFFYLGVLKHIIIGTGLKFYGLPKIFKAKGSTIKIGNHFENRNWKFSNPLGINHPTVLCTWKKGAQIVIGDNVGISGGSIVSSSKVEIGDGTLIGANTLIIDSDFHPIKSKNRRYQTRGIKSESVKIGKNVFIGTNCTILKGSVIKDDSIIPAGAIVY